jgi:hypothetical protein
MMSSAAVPVEIIPGYRESHSGIGRKPFAFPPESLFAFSPESCSSSPRNRFRVHPGTPFALPRNPHPGHRRFEPQIMRAIDFAHASSSDGRKDLVGAEFVAD